MGSVTASSDTSSWACSLKAANREREVKTAEPIAKPLPVAAVVLPSASSESVMHRTSSGMAGSISARPPALSATGPQASVASVMPSVASMPTAAMATPYAPLMAAQPRMAQTRTTIVGTQLIMPTPKPWIVTVAGPVAPLALILFTGAKSKDVKYSVILPIIIPHARPISTQMYAPHMPPSRWQHAAPKPKKIMPASMVPFSNAHIRAPKFEFQPSPFSLVLTAMVPIMAATTPQAESQKGNAISLSRFASVAAAMMEPTYDSNKSAPMPATSPTLSPTLSAMTAGLCGSSSSMPASTLPTRSAPTSAAFV